MASLFEGKIESVNPNGGKYYTLEIITSAELAESKPGQFVMLGLKASGAAQELLHPFSIYNVERRGDEAALSLFVAAVGDFTNRLCRSKPGQTVVINGPLGNSFSEPPQGDAPIFMVGGGYGIAPFYFYCRRALDRGVPKTRLRVFYGAKTKNDLLLTPKLEGMGIYLTLATEDGSGGHKGFVTAPLEAALGKLGEAERKGALLLGCGPHGLLEALGKIANKAGAKGELSYEAFFACGIGLCRGCAVEDKTGRFKMVCQHGPIFLASDMLE